MAGDDDAPLTVRGRISGFSLSTDGGSLAIGSTAGFEVIELRTLQRVLAVPSDHPTVAIAITADGRLVARSEYRALGAKMNSPVVPEAPPSGLSLPVRPVAAAWHPARSLLAVACDDASVVVLEWDESAEFLEVTRRFDDVGQARVEAVRWSQGGRALCCSLSDGGQTELELAGAGASPPRSGPVEWQPASAVSSDGRYHVQLAGHQVFVGRVAPDPGAGQADANVQLYDVASGERVGNIQTRSDVRSLQFAPGGNELALMRYGWQIHDVATGWPLFDIRSRLDVDPLLKTDQKLCRTHRVAFSPCGTLFATGGKYAEVQLWTMADGQHLQSLTIERLTGPEQAKLRYRHDERVESLAFRPDGELLAIGSNQEIHLWNLHTGEIDAVLQVPRLVWQLAFSPDGSNLLAASDRDVELWDLATDPPSVRTRWAGGGREQCNLAFDPSGTVAISGGYGDDAVCFRDVATGDELSRWCGREEPRR